jgi:hypothetical protein
MIIPNDRSSYLYHLESSGMNCIEILYELAVHTISNENEYEESAVFITLISKLNETKKFLLQFPDNNIHPLQSNKTDLFHFIDQNIGVVSKSIQSKFLKTCLL